MILKIKIGIRDNFSLEEFLTFRCCDRGWDRILREMFQELFTAGWDGEISQIKEKYGTLRVYLGFTKQYDDDELYKIVFKYEKLSETVCEVCGADGAKLRTMKDGRSWIKTNCDICHDIFMKTSPKMVLDTRK